MKAPIVGAFCFVSIDITELSEIKHYGNPNFLLVAVAAEEGVCMTIPATPNAVLEQLRQRGIELLLEKTMRIGPRGYAIPARHLWARGPITCQDWERVRRHREGLIRLLEREDDDETGALPPPSEMAVRMLYPELDCSHPRVGRALIHRATVS